METTQLEVNGNTYESVPEISKSSCEGCVVIHDDYTCDRICSEAGSYSCAGIIWIKKEKTEVTTEMKSEVQTETTEPKYTVSEVLEAVHYVEGSFLWDYCTQIEQYLAKQSSPDYQLYLELKAKFGE